MSAQPIKKLYYSISEVAEITGLKQYVLRYWETEFLELRPSKNRAGNRIYKDKDIRLINQIKALLYDKKYTIEGARNHLHELHDAQRSASPKSEPQKNLNIELLDGIQSELEEILKILDENVN